MNINTYTKWEGQLIQVNGGGLTQTFTIGNIYRPPRSLNENYNEFVNEFSTVISSLKNNQKQNLILAGYYNINMLKINEHEHCSKFFDMLTSFSLFPQITFPTRFSDRKGTLIDNFLCTLTKHTPDSRAGILIKKLSDHQPYFLILDTALKKEQSFKFVHINIQNETAMLKVKHYLTYCEIRKKLDVSPNADTHINYNIILDEIDRAKNKFMPSKMVKLKNI